MDAQEKEIAVFFCPDCDTEICACVIERIRKQEDAMIAARQALESLDTVNKKLTKEKDGLVVKIRVMEEKLRDKLKQDIKQKRAAIDAKYNRYLNKQKLV